MPSDEIQDMGEPQERTYDGFHVVLVMLGIFVVMLMLSFWLSASAMQ